MHASRNKPAHRSVNTQVQELPNYAAIKQLTILIGCLSKPGDRESLEHADVVPP